MQKISESLDYINSSTNNLNNGCTVWTSTQNDNYNAWSNDGRMLDTLPKMFDGNYVVPIYSLYD